MSCEPRVAPAVGAGAASSATQLPAPKGEYAEGLKCVAKVGKGTSPSVSIDRHHAIAASINQTRRSTARLLFQRIRMQTHDCRLRQYELRKGASRSAVRPQGRACFLRGRNCRPPRGLGRVEASRAQPATAEISWLCMPQTDWDLAASRGLVNESLGLTSLPLDRQAQRHMVLHFGDLPRLWVRRQVRRSSWPESRRHDRRPKTRQHL